MSAEPYEQHGLPFENALRACATDGVHSGFGRHIQLRMIKTLSGCIPVVGYIGSEPGFKVAP